MLRHEGGERCDPPRDGIAEVVRRPVPPTGVPPMRGCVRQAATRGREHVLPRLLVVPFAAARHPDLVAVVDDGRPAEEEEQVVGEEVAGESLPRVPRRGAEQREADAADVVVAEEGRQVVRRARGGRVLVVLVEQAREVGGRSDPRGVGDGRRGEREVEHARHAQAPHGRRRSRPGRTPRRRC